MPFPLTTRQQYPFSERKHLAISNISVSRALRCSGTYKCGILWFFFFTIYTLKESDNNFKMYFQSNAFQNLKGFSDYPNSQLTTERKLFVTVNQFGASGRACGMQWFGSDHLAVPVEILHFWAVFGQSLDKSQSSLFLLVNGKSPLSFRSLISLLISF